MGKEKAAFGEGDVAAGDLARVDGHFSSALRECTAAIRRGCPAASSWPEKLGAGIYAGTDYLIERPEAARRMFGVPDESAFGERFREISAWASQMVGEVVPTPPKAGPELPAAAVAGALLLIAQQVRLARPDRLADLRPDVHLLILLPYLEFGEAQRWAEAVYVARGY